MNGDGIQNSSRRPVRRRFLETGPGGVALSAGSGKKVLRKAQHLGLETSRDDGPLQLRDSDHLRWVHV